MEELWAATEKAVSKISSTAISLSVSATQTPVERQCAILSALLCHAVSDGCYDRKTHIGRVLSLPKEIQKRVMNIIERGRQIMSPRIRVRATPARDTAIKTPGSRRNRDEAFGTPASGYTPRRKKQSSGAGEGISAEGLFSPRTIENALGNIMEDLRIQNETLNTELETSQQREMELGAKIQEMEQSVRKQMMKVESEAYRNKEESRVDHEEEIKRLQEELKSLQKVKEQEENAQLELARVRDEIDLLKHTKDRLAETEEKFRMCRERLEELSEVREALKREEQAHAASVEECLRLDNDVKTLQPLRRQVEEYKTRAVDAEVKLAECQEDLKKVSHLSKHLSSAHKELLQGAKLHKEEAEELRKRLYEEDQQKKGPAIGESLSELNPQVREELSRLRNENVQLRDFAAKREVDSVQRLEEDLDDATRLSNKFKDQFLLYKNNLEATTKELVESQKNEANLSVQLDESRSKWEALNERANHLENALMTTREELDETAQMLKESKQREEGLINDVKTWVEKHAETEALSNQRQHTLDETRSELDQTKASLEKSRERETDLESIVKDLNGKIGQHQTFEEELQTQLQQRGYEVSDLQSKLQNASEREVTLKGELLGSSEQRLELEQKLEKKQLAHEAAVQEATEKLSATKENLQNKRKADLKQLQSKMDTILSEERETYHNELKKAADDYANLMAKSSTEYQKLKENASSALQTTKEEASAKAAETKKAHEEEVAKMKSKAEAEREKLIQKGKTMLRESRSKAQATIKEIEDELNETQESLANVRKDKESFENQARSKIHSYKHKLKFATSRMKELSDENTDLQESINNVEREKLKVQEENERFRRQLGGRYGADGKVQSQLEMLQKEFSAVVEDNRTLKRKLLATGGSSRSLGSISESNEFEDGNSKRKYSRGGVSGSTLSSMREEYEEQLQALNDEKRELIMRNSAAISETQKAEQRAWELEKELGRIKEELTSTQLSLQRAERDAEDDTDVSHYDEHPLIERASTLQGQEHRSSNLLLKLEEKPVPDKSYSVPILPTNTMSTMSTTDTSSTLEKESYGDENVVPQPKSSMAKSNPMESGPSLVESTNGPSLVELTQPGNGQDGQPECKQS